MQNKCTIYFWKCASAGIEPRTLKFLGAGCSALPLQSKFVLLLYFFIFRGAIRCQVVRRKCSSADVKIFGNSILHHDVTRHPRITSHQKKETITTKSRTFSVWQDLAIFGPLWRLFILGNSPYNWSHWFFFTLIVKQTFWCHLDTWLLKTYCQ